MAAITEIAAAHFVAVTLSLKPIFRQRTRYNLLQSMSDKCNIVGLATYSLSADVEVNLCLDDLIDFHCSNIWGDISHVASTARQTALSSRL